MRTCGGCAPGVFSSKAMLPLLSALLRRGLLSVCVSLARTVGRFDGWLPRGWGAAQRGPMARARGRATPEAPTFQTLSPPPTAEVSKVAFERGRWDVRWWGRGTGVHASLLPVLWLPSSTRVLLEVVSTQAPRCQASPAPHRDCTTSRPFYSGGQLERRTGAARDTDALRRR